MKRFFLTVIGHSAIYLTLLAQGLPLDFTFHYLNRAEGTGFDGSIGDLQILENGKHLVGGSFKSYNGQLANGLFLLLPDGQIDPDFNTGTGFQNSDGDGFFVRSIQVQSDGKFLLGGRFTSYNGSEANRLVRLNPDGSRDASFQTAAGFDKEVTTVVLQSDGKMLVSGHFTSYQNEPVPSLVRINPDGSRDTSFIPQGISENRSRVFALQEDGKILVNAGNNFFRLHPDGSMDTSFQLAEPFGISYTDIDYGTINHYFEVYSILLEADGKIWLSGFMQESLKGMVSSLRLLSDGSVDESFNMYTEEIGYANLNTFYFVKNKNGEVYTVREPYEGEPARTMERWLPDGTPESYYTEIIPTEELQHLNKILGVKQDGQFLVSGVRDDHIVIFRFNGDGSLDRSYNPIPEFNLEVNALSLQPDGKILAAGKFTHYNGKIANSLARIHPDGTLDGSFDAGTGLDHTSSSSNLFLFTQPDGKIWVIGNFSAYQGNPASGIIRINSDGSLDNSFQTGTGFKFPSQIQQAFLQDDGKVVISTALSTTFNGMPFQGLIRLNPDGSKDTSFDIGLGFDTDINSLATAPNDQFLVGGSFTSFNGQPVKSLVRLNADGSLDSSFSVSEKMVIRVNKLLLQPDGKILVFGPGGPAKPGYHLIRLHPDGSLDPGFKAGIPLDYEIGTMLLQADGKILLSLGNHASKDLFARLMPDGSMDPTLKLGEIFNGDIQTMTMDSNGNLLAGGSFTAFDKKNAYRIAQIPNMVEQPAALKDVYRINAGGPYLYRGLEVWLPDTRFSGGRSFTNPVPISNTENDALYQTERHGDFSYEIPVYNPGLYTLELHFAEIHWERSGARLFDLFVENNLFRSNIDLVKDNGVRKANIIRIEDLEVKDGNLSLELISRKDRAKISGIALYRQTQREKPENIRINAGGEALYYRGEEWLADRYYLGGKIHFDDSKPINASSRNELYHSERYGKFSYRIPVPKAGQYQLVLYFTEIFWENEGERVFDILVENGQSKLENLDLIKLIGEPNKAYMQHVGGIEVLDGILDLEFIPRVNEAKLSGIHLSLNKQTAKAPVIAQPRNLTLNEGQDWSYQIEASSPVEGESLTYFATGLPETVSVDPDTGRMSGNFGSPGRYSISLKVADSRGLAAYSDFSITVNPLTVIRRINAGGFWLESEDIQWQGNLHHPSGSIFSTNAPISNTELDTVYQSERNGDFSFEIKVPAIGYYTVELHFAEIHWTRENARLFRYQLENEPLSEIIDLYKDHGGANHAYIRTIHDVQVKDGHLSLEMISVKDRAKLSGIVVYRQGTLAAAARMAPESLMGKEFTESNREEKHVSINLYPNPARDHITVEFDVQEAGTWSFVLVNSLGVSTYLDRVNLETGLHRLVFNLPALHLSAGTYYLRMESEQEAPRVMRVIIH